MTTSPISSLRCIACGTQHEVTTARFACQSCGDLLAVEHDLDALKQRFGDLKQRFDQRASAFGSGVWRYHEMILPDLPAASIVTLNEGSTGLYSRPAIDAFVGCKRAQIKHEGENPTLSFKDRGMTAGVSWAKHVKARRVACASTGDTSAAMAAYAASADVPGVVLLPHEKVSLEQLAQPISYGARVLALQTDFDGCMRLVKQLTESGEIYLLNSMNPFRIEGQKAIGIEAVHQRGWKVPDWFVIPVGNAGNISALGKGLRELHALGLIDRLPRLAGIQVAAADPFYRAYKNDFAQRQAVVAQPTVASAIRIGDPVSYDKARKVVQGFDGVVGVVDDQAALDAKASCDAAGVHICPNSGVALAGARQLVKDGVIGKDQEIVVIATAHGAKFSQAAIDYHSHDGGPLHNTPRVLPAELTAIHGALG
ncbi:MAG: threonine synthase [Deltaproteobacteria bacterium]|nr:threonine synthase [Deltaproteobacteria bacterium]